MADRALIVGLGSIGKRHAHVIKQLRPDCEIIALRSRGCPEIPEPGIDYCVTSLDDALRLKPRLAVIANPASHHVASAIPLVEKPISSMAGDVPELIDTCRRHHVVLMTAYNMRFLPSLQRFRQLIQERRVKRMPSR